MPRAHAPLFDRERDNRVNGARKDELHAYGIPCGWIAVSPVECQALLEGIVSTEIMKQACSLLAPDPWVLAEEK